MMTRCHPVNALPNIVFVPDLRGRGPLTLPCISRSAAGSLGSQLADVVRYCARPAAAQSATASRASAGAILDDKITFSTSGTIDTLKIEDPIPSFVGKYELADIGEYENLVPIIPYGSSTPTSTPITTVDGFYNAVFWDGTNFTQIKIAMPNTKEYSKSLLRTSFYPSVLDFNSAIDFTLNESGKITEIKIKSIRLSYNGNFAETNTVTIFNVPSYYGYVVATFTDYTAGGITLEYIDGFEWNAVLSDQQFIMCFVNNGVLYSKYAEIQALISQKYNPGNSGNATFNSEYHSLFQNFKTGVIDWQNGFQGSDMFDGECLTVTGYVILPIKPKNTNVRILVKGYSNAQIRLSSNDLTSFYSIYVNSGNLNVAKTGVGILGNLNGAVDASKDYYLEIYFGDSEIKARAWNVSQKSNWDVTVDNITSIGDVLTLNEYSGNTYYKDVLYYDSTVALYNQIQFNGYFFEEIKGDEKLIRTFNQGVSFEFETNSKKANLIASFEASHTPTLAVSVDGSKPYIINLVNGTTPLFDNLPAGNHQIKVWVDGIFEGDWFWTDSAKGIFIKNVNIEDGAYIRKPIDNRKTIAVIGDSITEGVNVRGTGGLPIDASGYNVYSNTLARILDLRPLVHGFGATGIAVGGSGQVPKYMTSIANYRQGKRAFNEDIPNYILINGGTNDGGNSVPNATFTSEYQSLIDNQKNKYPAAKIILLVPFNGVYKTQIKALGVNNSLDVIDLSLFAGISTSDGTHPDLTGTVKMAEQLAGAMKNIL